MNRDQIASAVKKAAEIYPIKKVILFGSQARGAATEKSDVDLIIEFSSPVTLITISKVQLFLEDQLKKDVDVIHGPIRPTDLLEIDKEIEIYAA
ncbi:MAG: nucleotidyltransferase domain-containing protein [Clostridia bacterium]|nr:nucleotidyltransferase domain-containing protein [Clostridia bacterium]